MLFKIKNELKIVLKIFKLGNNHLKMGIKMIWFCSVLLSLSVVVSIFGVL